ncbi:MAG: thiamine-phosphate kinase [Thermodesulfovibrionales bacterium]
MCSTADMRLGDIGELSLLEGIKKRFRAVSKEVIAGIGDDSAVVAPRGQKLLLTTDMMIEGIHFDPDFITPYQLGFKIISVNVSDIYAMGGSPRFALLDVAMDRDREEEFVESFFDGIQEAMRIYRVMLIGGDLSSSRSGMIVSATLIGYAKIPLMRSGARPGDRIYVTGNLGDSACGLEILKRIKRHVPITPSMTLPPRGGDPELRALTTELSKLGLRWNVVEPLFRRHLLPEARSPKKIMRFATSMIDISDGLFIDLSRLCNESRVGARVYMKQIPVSTQMKRAASAMGLDHNRFATSGGEDYELLFTAPSSRRVNAFCIGEITTSERTVVLNGEERPFSAEGYQHWH